LEPVISALISHNSWKLPKFVVDSCIIVDDSEKDLGLAQRFFAAGLVHLKVDTIVVSGGNNLIQEAKNATKTIPSLWWMLGSILSRQASLKALPVPVATSLALQTLLEN
jgi:hypothetical protein